MSEDAQSPHRIDAIAWAFFFIWIGVALLTKLGWGWSLLGIGAIILAAQAALFMRESRMDGFWMVCGLAFVAGGAWSLLGLTWSLGPVLLVLVGLVILGRAFFGTSAPRT